MILGVVSCDLRIASIIPIFGKRKKRGMENYRSVSLTSILCKVFEEILRGNKQGYGGKWKIG